MELQVIIHLLLGAAAPFVTAFMVQRGYPPVVKVLISLSICAAAATILALAQGSLDYKNIAASTSSIFAIGQGLYAIAGKKLTGGIEVNWGNLDGLITEPVPVVATAPVTEPVPVTVVQKEVK
jgi:hypothetical protein